MIIIDYIQDKLYHNYQLWNIFARHLSIMNTYNIIDQMGLPVDLPTKPKRIISLVPSQTELLFDIGLDKTIVGITRFCNHPIHIVNSKVKIGGTKNFNIEVIKDLAPDLIIGNKEENYEAGILELKKHYHVWMSDITTIDDAYTMMDAIGTITNKSSEVEGLIKSIKDSFSELPIVHYPLSIPTVAYFIWRKPYMVAASGTFIDSMLNVLGVVNAFAGLSRYPELSTEHIAACKADYIFLSSEPYSFSEMHFEEFQDLCPTAKIIVVDGELFSWYGSRLKHSADYFVRLRTQMIDSLY